MTDQPTTAADDTDEGSLNKQQAGLFADVLADADSTLARIAVHEMMQHGNGNRVVLKLAAMTAMAMWAFKTPEESDTTIEGQMGAFGGIMQIVLDGLETEGKMHEFGVGRLRTAHETISAITRNRNN